MRTAVVFIALMSAAVAVSSCGSKSGSAGETQNQPAVKSEVSIPQITSQSMDDFLSRGGYVFLEFGGKSCVPCKEMQPILRRLQSEHADVRVGIIYNEDSPELLERWSIQLIPTQIVLGPDKKEITRHVGLWEYDEIMLELRGKGVVR
jgi:thioredoxin 1